jgi:hypothetical protein
MGLHTAALQTQQRAVRLLTIQQDNSYCNIRLHQLQPNSSPHMLKDQINKAYIWRQLQQLARDTPLTADLLKHL